MGRVPMGDPKFGYPWGKIGLGTHPLPTQAFLRLPTNHPQETGTHGYPWVPTGDLSYVLLFNVHIHLYVFSSLFLVLGSFFLLLA